ncbi:DUF2314 domain-containing protein [Mucilaginibacter sp. 14171R-50]|uniref:DUF2314 domain-containing protein n=1 Tax=Mucilaginibacter sp. 14171R-50 TaxID=2703789 RepID=UPI00138CA99F|nr:DUF2314 domain-containing protein [Mucilaginibacter sp. 14171R-50]QHS54211.1 DUF2314 domain-containing protein [Mucilaginibacter sp. 14171R-50]
MTKNYLKASVVLLLVWSACNNPKKDKAEKVEVINLKTDDEKFLALKDTAQAKLNIFLDSLKPHALDSNYRFLVKSDFAEGKDHEHMWSVVYKYADGKFTGIFADSAVYLKNIKMGDHVLINQKDVEDWAIYDYKRNTDMGNFSDKYLRSKQGK